MGWKQNMAIIQAGQANDLAAAQLVELQALSMRRPGMETRAVVGNWLKRSKPLDVLVRQGWKVISTSSTGAILEREIGSVETLSLAGSPWQLRKQLATLGQQGWKIVSASPTTGVILERPSASTS